MALILENYAIELAKYEYHQLAQKQLEDLTQNKKMEFQIEAECLISKYNICSRVMTENFNPCIKCIWDVGGSSEKMEYSKLTLLCKE